MTTSIINALLEPAFITRYIHGDLSESQNIANIIRCYAGMIDGKIYWGKIAGGGFNKRQVKYDKKTNRFISYCQDMLDSIIDLNGYINKMENHNGGTITCGTDVIFNHRIKFDFQDKVYAALQDGPYTGIRSLAYVKIYNKITNKYLKSDKLLATSKKLNGLIIGVKDWYDVCNEKIKGLFFRVWRQKNNKIFIGEYDDKNKQFIIHLLNNIIKTKKDKSDREYIYKLNSKKYKFKNDNLSKDFVIQNMINLKNSPPKSWPYAEQLSQMYVTKNIANKNIEFWVYYKQLEMFHRYINNINVTCMKEIKINNIGIIQSFMPYNYKNNVNKFEKMFVLCCTKQYYCIFDPEKADENNIAQLLFKCSICTIGNQFQYNLIDIKKRSNNNINKINICYEDIKQNNREYESYIDYDNALITFTGLMESNQMDYYNDDKELIITGTLITEYVIVDVAKIFK